MAFGFIPFGAVVRLLELKGGCLPQLTAQYVTTIIV